MRLSTNLEEGYEDTITVMEVVMDEVDEEVSVHHVRDELMRWR